MADYIAAHITIGGRVPRRLVSELCEVICKQGVSLDWGEFDFCPRTAADLRRACGKVSGSKVLRLYSDEVAYGNLGLLQDFLLDQLLPFDRWHEAKYDIPCELMVYRPRSELRFYLTNLEGEVVVRSQPLIGLANLLQEAQHHLHAGAKSSAQKALRRCQRLVANHLPPAIAPLPSLTIVSG